MTQGVDQIRAWCAASGLPCRDHDGVLLLRLQDDDHIEVRVEAPDGGAPMRLDDRVALDAAGLTPSRLAEVIEDVVLGRSSLVDARPSPEADGAEVVVVVHPEGLNRHTFVEAVFEVQKIRLLLRREVAAAVAAEQTLTALETLAGEAWATATPSG